MIKVEIPMGLERETKNKVVYRADDSTVMVENVYIRKSDLPSKPPREVVVTIEYDD